VGGNQDGAGQRHHHQAAASDVGQFSGGEPTLSPYFLDAVRYARKVGYNSVQAATNGIEFAKSFEFCQQAVEAGMRTRTCSLTESATPRTIIAPWATFSM